MNESAPMPMALSVYRTFASTTALTSPASNSGPVGVAPVQRIRAPLARPEFIIEDAVTHFLRSGYLILVARQTDFERTDPAQGGSVHDVVRSDARNAPFSIGPGFGGSHFGRRHVCMHERFSFEPSLLARGYSLGATGL